MDGGAVVPWLPEESDEQPEGTVPEPITLGGLFQMCSLSGEAVSAASVAAVPFDALDVGDELAGYRLILRLGKGAFGRVFLAEEQNLARRLVVVKVSQRQLDEPHALARLQHSHIVPIYSLHDDPITGLQAIVMPYLGGTTMDRILRTIGDPTRNTLSGRDLLRIVDGYTAAVYRRLQEVNHLPESSGAGQRDWRESFRSLASLVDIRSVTVSASSVDMASYLDDEDRPAQSGPARDWLGALVRKLRYDPVPLGDSPRAALSALCYERAVQWIGARLAEALYHAHSRGVLHRDVKPGNILIGQDGRPMLLDFNLAYVSSEQAQQRCIGGTLPYMAPEHLEAFARGDSGEGTVDERADIYSLGVVLYELLTGRCPFPTDRSASTRQRLQQLIESRRQLPPSVRSLNPRVSPAFAAIIQKCLQPDPADRYQSTAHLAEDLQRDLESLPLRYTAEPSLRYRAQKWCRRHPKITLAGAIVTIGLAVIAVLGMALASAGQRIARIDLAQQRARFARLFQQTQLLTYAAVGEPGSKAFQTAWRSCEEALQMVRDAGLVPAESLAKPEQVDEVFFMAALLTKARAGATHDAERRRQLYEQALRYLREARALNAPPSRASLLLAAELHTLLGNTTQATELRQQAEERPLSTAHDLAMEATRVAARRDFEQAIPLFQRALQLDPGNFWAAFGLAVCYQALGQVDEALAAYFAAANAWPECGWVYLNRGQLLANAGRYADALADLNHAIKLLSNVGLAYAARGSVLLRLRRYEQAAEDLRQAVALGPVDTRLLTAYGTALAWSGQIARALEVFERAATIQGAGDSVAIAAASALADRAPRTAMSWLDRALRGNPRNPQALYLRGYILAEKLDRPELAQLALEQCLKIKPHHTSALALAALLDARAGRDARARRRAELAEAMTATAADLYTLASCYARLAEREPRWKARCVELLRRAAAAGADLSRLRDDADFAHLWQDRVAARLLEELLTRTASEPAPPPDVLHPDATQPTRLQPLHPADPTVPAAQ